MLDFTEADTLPLEDLATVINACFEGYIVPVKLDRAQLLHMIRVESLDLTASIVARSKTETVAVALIGRRGWTCRLSLMAVHPRFRGQGRGRVLLENVLQSARGRGDRHCVLECIEQNAPALRLYETAGFDRARRLLGYAPGSIAPTAAGLEEIDPVEVSGAVRQWGVSDLPCQISAPTLASLARPNRAFRLGPALALISNPELETIAIRSVVTDPIARRCGHASRLLRAISAAFPGRKWRVPAVCPEEVPEAFFMKLGLLRDAISQFQMRRALDGVKDGQLQPRTAEQLPSA